MKIAVVQDSISYAGSGIMSDRADRRQHHHQKINLTPRSLRLESWRLRGAPVTRSLSHPTVGVEPPRVAGSNRKDPTMEAARPRSFNLLPSRLTTLRQWLNIDVPTAANRLGLSPHIVRYLEDHTRRLSPDTWEKFDIALTSVEGPQPISIWDWLAELDAKEAQQTRADQGDL